MVYPSVFGFLGFFPHSFDAFRVRLMTFPSGYFASNMCEETSSIIWTTAKDFLNDISNTLWYM